MKKIIAFIKGSLLAALLLMALALGLDVILLATKSDIFVNNMFMTIYCSGMSANVMFGTLPTLLCMIAGGVLNLKKYNAQQDEEITENI